MSSLKTIKGYITTPAQGVKEGGARVAVEEDGVVYHVAPRGAGVDLDDHLSALVQVTGIVHQDEHGESFVTVRAYRLLEDDVWLEDE